MGFVVHLCDGSHGRREMTRTCPISVCKERLSLDQFMCVNHWEMVPLYRRCEVVREYCSPFGPPRDIELRKAVGYVEDMLARKPQIEEEDEA